jgi:hypothetical protein
MAESTKPATATTFAPWVRERGIGTAGAWHRPLVWPPTVPGVPVTTTCGREVVVDYHANVGVGGTPHPACPDCAP